MGNSIRLERVPPQNIDAERAVLGGMMLVEGGQKAIALASRILGNSDGSVFYKESHQKIYTAILHLFNSSEPSDLLTVTRDLERIGELEKVGGVSYLDELIDSVPTAANIEYYAQMVKDEAIRRKVIYTSAQIYNEAYDQTEEIEKLLNSVSNLSDNLQKDSNTNPQEEPEIKAGLNEIFEELQKPKDYGIKSGFTDLDHIIMGFPKGTVSLVSGCTHIGKSQFVQTIVQNIMDDYYVLYFSTEMSKRLIQKRFLASEAGITTHRLEERNFSDDIWVKLTHAAGKISQSKIRIFDNIRHTSELRSTIRWYKDMGKADLIIIDHLGHLKPYKPKERRVDEVSEISSDLHDIAVMEDIPIIAISHIKRISDRANKRPTLFDLRDSGSLENDADRVIFLHRDSFFEFQETGKKAKDNGKTEVIVAKDRIFGYTGTAELCFVNNRYYGTAREDGYNGS